ncbi:17540_t:CDS:2 [Cetraspora pellucida]|uniref:17540_t:CDS:1 n=1 Tax=Cetraspora pellucida TaxID=1433469 RepID=A0A9N9A3U0_9GLOM|nr:17540_t:CDS:2 [Cetraspora pellucida]
MEKIEFLAKLISDSLDTGLSKKPDEKERLWTLIDSQEYNFVTCKTLTEYWYLSLKEVFKKNPQITRISFIRAIYDIILHEEYP